MFCSSIEKHYCRRYVQDDDESQAHWFGGKMHFLGLVGLAGDGIRRSGNAEEKLSEREILKGDHQTTMCVCLLWQPRVISHTFLVYWENNARSFVHYMVARFTLEQSILKDPPPRAASVAHTFSHLTISFPQSRNYPDCVCVCVLTWIIDFKWSGWCDLDEAHRRARGGDKCGGFRRLNHRRVVFFNFYIPSTAFCIPIAFSWSFCVFVQPICVDQIIRFPVYFL